MLTSRKYYSIVCFNKYESKEAHLPGDVGGGFMNGVCALRLHVLCVLCCCFFFYLESDMVFKGLEQTRSFIFVLIFLIFLIFCASFLTSENRKD